MAQEACSLSAHICQDTCKGHFLCLDFFLLSIHRLFLSPNPFLVSFEYCRSMFTTQCFMSALLLFTARTAESHASQYNCECKDKRFHFFRLKTRNFYWTFINRKTLRKNTHRTCLIFFLFFQATFWASQCHFHIERPYRLFFSKNDPIDQLDDPVQMLRFVCSKMYIPELWKQHKDQTKLTKQRTLTLRK